MQLSVPPAGVISYKLIITKQKWRDASDAMRSERVLVSLRNTPVAWEPGVFPLSPLLHALAYKTEIGGRGRKDYFPRFPSPQEDKRTRDGLEQ